MAHRWSGGKLRGSIATFTAGKRLRPLIQLLFFVVMSPGRFFMHGLGRKSTKSGYLIKAPPPEILAFHECPWYDLKLVCHPDFAQRTCVSRRARKCDPRVPASRSRRISE